MIQLLEMVHQFRSIGKFGVGHGSGRPAGRVGSGWVGSEFSANLAGRVEISDMDYFLSASVEFRKFNSPFIQVDICCFVQDDDPFEFCYFVVCCNEKVLD